MKGQLKTRFFQSLIPVLLVCLSFWGWGGNAQAKTIKMRFSHHLPPVAPVAKALAQWAERIEADTGGRITITIYPSSTLAKGKDAFPSVAAGICDITYVNNVYEPSRWGLNNIVNSLALPIPTDERGVKIWDKLWEKFPEMLKEYEGVKVLSHVVTMPSALHTKNPARTPNDLKGMKIAAMGVRLKLLALAGGSPVGMPANEWYLGLEKGVIAGTFCPIGLLTDRGIEMLLPYHVDMQIGQGGNSLIINLNKFKSLPADVQTILNDLYLWTNNLIITANHKAEDAAWEKCRALGHSITKLKPEELKIWTAAAQPLADKWIEDNAKKGPTKHMFAYACQLIEEIEK